MQNQQDRAPYGLLESYFPHRVNYAEAVSRPHEEATRRSDEFIPPGARWLASKKSMPSSPAPNRVLPQPQAMNHFPYQATAAMLPTPPMSVRQPNGRHKHTSDENLESFEFPPLATHWPSLQEDADRERWRHSEDSGTHGRQGSASPQHVMPESDKSSLDRRDSHYIPTNIPSNSWWRRRDSLPNENYDSISFQHDDADQADDRPSKKRCQNAFFVFSSERRGEIRAQQPRIRNSDLNKILGKEWNDLSEEHRSHYKNRAEILKEQSYQSDHNASSSGMIGSLFLSSLSPSSPSTSSSPGRYNDNNSSDANMFSTPRHLSISSERSHDALFVAANNASPDGWQTNHGSKDHDDDQDSDDEEQDSSSASPPLATTGARNVVSVASHSGAAEAEALAGLTVPRTDALKRLPLKRHGEKPKRVKRPPNAYLLFNRDIRHQILDGNPNLTVAEISKAISERWNSLPEESKRYYNQEAARLKQRHMDEHPNFIYTRRSKLELEEAGYRSRPSKKRKVEDPPPASNSSSESAGDKPAVKERDPRGRKKKRLKNPTAPKHPMSGFLFYSKSVRAEIVVTMPKATVGEISKVIAKRWRRLTEDERAPWVGKAKEDKARYAREMETFTATSMVDGLDEDHGRQGNMSPAERELDSHTIATVAQMVNPRGEHLMPPLSSSPRQYQVLPATPRNDD